MLRGAVSYLKFLPRLLFWLGRAAWAVLIGGIAATVGGMFGIGVTRNLDNPDPDLSNMLGIAVFGGVLGSVVGIAVAALIGLPALMAIGVLGLRFPWARSRLTYMAVGVAVAWYAGTELMESLQAPEINAYTMAIFAFSAGLPSALTMHAIMERRRKTHRADAASSSAPPTATT